MGAALGVPCPGPGGRQGHGQGVPCPGHGREVGERQGVPWSWLEYPLPPVDKQSENITFPRTLYAGGNNWTSSTHCTLRPLIMSNIHKSLFFTNSIRCIQTFFLLLISLRSIFF